MILIKKAISYLISPFSVFWVLVLFSHVHFFHGRRFKRFPAIFGFSILLLFSSGYFSNTLLSYLENPFKKVTGKERLLFDGSLKRLNPHFVVVLGGGFVNDPGIPTSSKLNHHSLVRLVEGVRILNLLPETKLLLSGGSIGQGGSVAEAMKNMAIELGVSESKIILESYSKDTHDEATILKKMINNKPFVLVTSAFHMRRAIGLFRRLALEPIPAPAGFLSHNGNKNFLKQIFPSSRNLYLSELAMHEYFGMLWSSLRGQI